MTRRLTPNLRLKVRYAFFHSEDVPSGGELSYDSHVLFTSLQYRFEAAAVPPRARRPHPCSPSGVDRRFPGHCNR